MLFRSNYDFILASAYQLPFPSESFDRIIVTCLFLHLDKPELAMKEIRRVVRPKGEISIYMPTEPSLILNLIRKSITKRKATKLGFAGYDLFVARDHITYFKRILELIKYIFCEDKIKVKYRPIPLKTWYFNAFCIIRIIRSQV